ncbi:hypothetical protein [Collinsella sp. An307]|uniref:hypothetical protein n=1 Tax=Collinsella sp. An307 TaxID=1965630 RepID=UPI000B376653|nr:hypothetical protein [Collinsella sp. An307]OUO22469.1 hypothetical protein B5F89_01145 [Collinsella sp. An307]
MGYHTTNAAYAYDMQAVPAYAPAAPAPRTQERPRFDVYTGQGREANQLVSPAFTHVLKVFAVLVALVFTIGMARVGIASLTAAELNANATVSNELTAARDQSGDLEVMRSVYGADARIRDLAEDTLGMVEPASRITLDMSDAAAGAAAASTAE